MILAGLILVCRSESMLLSQNAQNSQRNITRYRRHPPNYDWRLVQEPADAYVVSAATVWSAIYRKFDDKYQLSLFCADMLQAIGAFMDVRWVHEGSVNVGSYCRAQGQSKYLPIRSVY